MPPQSTFESNLKNGSLKWFPFVGTLLEVHDDYVVIAADPNDPATKYRGTRERRPLVEFNEVYSGPLSLIRIAGFDVRSVALGWLKCRGLLLFDGNPDRHSKLSHEAYRNAWRALRRELAGGSEAQRVAISEAVLGAAEQVLRRNSQAKPFESGLRL